MAKAIESFESKVKIAKNEAEANAQTQRPKPSLGILRRAFTKWSNSWPCVQNFHAECAAQDKVAEAQKKVKEG